MSLAVQNRRGTTGQHAAFTGLLGELTIDTTKKTVVVHDGVTPGGFPMAREAGNGVRSDSIARIETIFQRDYDLLTSPDLQTIYVIVPFRFVLESGVFGMTGYSLAV